MSWRSAVVSQRGQKPVALFSSFLSSVLLLIVVYQSESKLPLSISGSAHWVFFWCFLFCVWWGCSALKRNYGGLPWWRSGWESACQCRGHGFEPWSGRIPYAAEQLGPWATTTEPASLEPVLRNKRGCDSERPAHHDEEGPLLAATRESPHTETKTQHSQK